MQPELPENIAHVIQIIHTLDGQIQCSWVGQPLNRPIANMLLETAKQDIISKILAEQRPQVVGAPPNLATKNLRG